MLKGETGVKVGASNYDEAVKHITILSPLLFFEVLAVPEPVLVLDGLDGMPKFCLVSAYEVNGCLNVVELGVVVRVGSSSNGPVKKCYNIYTIYIRNSVTYFMCYCSIPRGRLYEILKIKRRKRRITLGMVMEKF